jgi:hypothetical protein
MLDFRRALDSIRTACYRGQPECMMKGQLPGQANRIALEDRTYATAFLSQFHSAVKELSSTAGRRTIVFISDGFQLVPGKMAFELLVSYFPEFRSVSLSTVDRMHDLDPVLRLAANSNIPIYTIDSRGLYTSPFFEASNPGGAASVMPAVRSAMKIPTPATLVAHCPKLQPPRAAPRFKTVMIFYSGCSAPSPMGASITCSPTYRPIPPRMVNSMPYRCACTTRRWWSKPNGAIGP